MSETASFKDHFSGHAAAYAAARPQYPAELFAFIQDLCEEKQLAWDCGAGNGQASLGLLPYFQQVLATDGSYQQILEDCAPGNPDSGLIRAAMLAERVAIDSSSVDLVVVAQALHWFNATEFFAEVDRVLKPGGVIAVWCYGVQQIDAVVDRVIHKLYEDILGPFWPAERRLVEAGYRDFELPYPEVNSPEFRLQKKWCLDQLLAYFNSWSAVQRFRKSRGENPLMQIEDELVSAWTSTTAGQGQNPPAMQKVVSWPLSLRVAIKPAGKDQ